jgi:hypothetical protein
LLEYFGLEVTARCTADVLGLQANTTAMFYPKVRELIAEHAASDDSSSEFLLKLSIPLFWDFNGCLHHDLKKTFKNNAIFFNLSF